MTSINFRLLSMTAMQTCLKMLMLAVSGHLGQRVAYPLMPEILAQSMFG